MTGCFSLPVLLLSALLLCHTTTGQHFMLNGQRFNNHSLIRMENIGEVDSALYCVTSYKPCCKTTLIGEWTFPNGSLVTVRHGNHPFFRNRDDEGAVILQRRYNPVGPNGKYICTIPDQNGVMTKLYAGLYSALAFPTVLVQPESIQNAVPGSTVTFTLTASNAISYNWVLNEGFYLEDTGRHVGTTTNTLTINNVNKLDEGTYHCIVMRELSVATDQVTLTVLDPPVLESQPLDATNIKLGSNVTFTVLAVGLDLSYEWEFGDGSVLPDNPDYIGVDTPTFTIRNVTREDIDSYRCAVSNAAGTVYSTIANMSLVDPPVLESQPLDATNIKLGSNVTFTVLAVGLDLSYEWEFGDGSPLPDNPDYIGVDTPTFTIRNVTREDIGSYRCAVSNTAGTVYSAIANMSLVDPPVLESQPLDATNIKLGSNVTFTVLAVGLDLSYEWEFGDGNPLPDNPDYIGVDTPTFTIRNVTREDIGSYRCAVSNTAGTVYSAIANMSLARSPVTPLDVQPGITSVMVTWEPTVTEGLLGYRLVYYHMAFPFDKTSVDVTEATYTAVGLLPHGLYRFQVQQRTRNGLGLASTVDVKLTENIPPVEKVVISTVNATAMSVSWPPLSTLPGWNLSYYKLVYNAYIDDQPSKPVESFTKRTPTGWDTSIIFLYNELSADERAEHVFEVSAVIEVDLDGVGAVEGEKAVAKTKLELENCPFQIILGPIDYCVTWSYDKMQAIRKDIRSALAKVISERCNCDFNVDSIGEGAFSCRHTPNAVTYRSTVTSLNATDIIVFIDNWVQTQTASMLVRWFYVDVYSTNCPTKISTLSDSECRLNEQGATSNPPTLITSDQVVINCVNTCLVTEAGARKVCELDP